MNTTTAADSLPAWDLTPLYAGIDDPRLNTEMAALLERARRFAAAYRGRIATPGVSAPLLLDAIREYEEIERLAHRPLVYAHLAYAADSSKPRNGAVLQSLTEQATQVGNEILFFELEICAIPAADYARVVADDRLETYRHFLDKQRLFAPHRLSEPEEKILEEKANSGSRAFRRLFDETLANHTFRVVVAGETRELPEPEVMSLFFGADRDTRRAAAEGLTEGLRQHSRTLALTFNSLLLDKWTNDRLRRFDRPEASRHLSNELTAEVVDAVVAACVEGFALVADYYRLKGRLLGIEPLTHYDRYAPLDASTREIPYPAARDLVLGAFRAFSPEVHAAASSFFTGQRIDAAIRKGKQGGGFCASVDHEVPPYILMNYTARPRDVMTLAHELGHGVHGCLSQGQSHLNYHPVLPLAETASVFGELLVFEELMRQAPDDAERLAMLCEKIEETFGTTFRQIALYRFELAAHAQRREQGELSAEALNGLWQRTIQEMFGDSVVLGDDHGWWWSYIPHFIHTPFYVYAYAVGELLVLSLYARYRQEGERFIPRYLALLAAGGSRTPPEMLADIGIDISSPGFWSDGVGLIAGYVRQAWELAGALGRV